MEGISCDRCGEGLLIDDDVRYIMRVEMVAAYDPMEITRQDLERDLDARIALVISSRPEVKGIDHAAELGLPVQVVPRKQHDSTEAFCDAVWALIRPAGIDLVCMAGFLSLLLIPDDFAGRVLNIHPALLPDFGGRGMYGRRVHEAVLAAGESQSGCTVHFADNQYDHGRIILQRSCPVLPDDTPETLAERVLAAECEAYPEAVRQLALRLSPSH